MCFCASSASGPRAECDAKGGHSYDIMKVKSATDETVQTFYFNVDIPFKHYGV